MQRFKHVSKTHKKKKPNGKGQAFSVCSQVYEGKMNMESNLTQHLCAGKCTDYKEEQCNTCLVQQIEKQEFNLGPAPDDAYVQYDFIKGDVVVYSHRIADNSLETVEAFVLDEYYRLDSGQIIHKDDIQLASPAELKAKRRLDQPIALFVSG